MQIYSKSIDEKCHLSSIQKSQQMRGMDVYYASRNLLSTCYLWYGTMYLNDSTPTIFLSIWMGTNNHIYKYKF